LLPVVHIKRYCNAALLSVLCCFCLSANAQFFTLKNPKSIQVIPFRLVRNLVVIKLKINGKGPYNFVLDTGVGYMLITEPSLVDSVEVSNKRMVKIHGFGSGNDFEAYITNPLNIDIPGLTSYNVNAALFTKDNFGLSDYAGIPIHGLLGYEFFNRLAVKVDFSDSTLRVSLPQHMRYYKRGAKLAMNIEDRKPYITTNVTFANGDKKPSKLIVDLGAGHCLSMENLKNKSDLQKSYIYADLGMGINGPISGTLSRIREVELGKYKLKDIVSAFPDKDTVKQSIPRDGNIGIGLLRRFNLIIDYPNNALYLKPSLWCKRPDEHDMSGLTYYTARDAAQHIIIDNVAPGSAASMAGLLKGDEIMMINLYSVVDLSLQQIDDLFKSRDGRPFVLLIYRNSNYITVHMTLKRRV
jgi:hypothetical protein